MASAVRSCRRAVPEAVALDPGQQHGDLGLASGQRVGHQLHGGPAEPPVGALDDVEGDLRETDVDSIWRRSALACCRSTAKCTARSSSGIRVAGVLDGAGCGQVEVANEDEDNMGGGGMRAAAARWASSCSSAASVTVLVVQPEQQQHEDRDDDDDHPSALGELGDGDDHVDHEREHRADAVHEQAEGANPVP